MQNGVTFTISFWEIALLIIAIAFIFIAIALVRFLKKAATTMEKANALIESNTENVTKIVDNAGEATDRVKTLVDNAAGIAEKVLVILKVVKKAKKK